MLTPYVAIWNIQTNQVGFHMANLDPKRASEIYWNLRIPNAFPIKER